MKIKSFATTFGKVLGLLALPCCVSVSVAHAQSANSGSAQPLFVLDPLETHSRFEVKFLGFMTVRGKFNRTTGNLYHDPIRQDAASRASDSIQADIDATTLDTHVINSHATNEILRGPQFFHVEKFPAITFKSSVFNWDETTLKSIEGTLTLLGVTKPVTLTVEKSGCTSATAQKRARCTAEAFVNVKRADFGMKAWAASVSNDVKLTIELVAYQASNGGAESKNIDESATSKSAPVIPPASEP
jgi:polyisoprenoid-binding protein YceI